MKRILIKYQVDNTNSLIEFLKNNGLTVAPSATSGIFNGSKLVGSIDPRGDICVYDDNLDVIMGNYTE